MLHILVYIFFFVICWFNRVHLGIVECIGAAFLCGEGKCIPEESVCDGNNDCDTDELDCKLCIYSEVTTHQMSLELYLSCCQVEEFNMLKNANSLFLLLRYAVV